MHLDTKLQDVKKVSDEVLSTAKILCEMAKTVVMKTYMQHLFAQRRYYIASSDEKTIRKKIRLTAWRQT